MDKLITDLLKPVEKALEEAREAEAEKIRKAEAAKLEERSAKEIVRTLEGMAAKIKGETPIGPGRPKRKKGSSSTQVSEARAEEVFQAVKTLGDATRSEIAERVGGISNGSVTAALTTLRGQERVRMAGIRPRPDGTGRGSEFFVVMG